MFKILIADDEELSRSVIRCILEYYFKGKFLLFEASNGREAVCLALGERIDVAFPVSYTHLTLPTTERV